MVMKSNGLLPATSSVIPGHELPLCDNNQPKIESLPPVKNLFVSAQITP